jgi:hypothetical protein
VSDVNVKISGFGGSLNAGTGGSGLGGIAGSLTLPFGHPFGLQLDGAYARVHGDDFYDAGAHLFWRDPGVGLFGIYGGYAHQSTLGGQQIKRLGIEGEKYFGNLTLRGALGHESGNVASNIYGNAKLDLYLSPNAMITGGYTYEDTGFASAGAEVQLGSTQTTGLSLFANGNLHDSSTYQVLGGLKITFGQNMSLRDRQRRQDPATYTDVDLLAAEAASSRAANAVTYCATETAIAMPQTCTCPGGFPLVDGGLDFACSANPEYFIIQYRSLTCYPSRRTATPARIRPAAAARDQRKGSSSHSTAMAAANRMLDSRKAATSAIGALVMAQIAIQ